MKQSQKIYLQLAVTCAIGVTLSLGFYNQPPQGDGQMSGSRFASQKDYIDVPVRAGYRIMGDDKDGYLEDGIIVKTKGTGYIDPRYRKRYLRAAGNESPLYQQQQQQKFFNQRPSSSIIDWMQPAASQQRWAPVTYEPIIGLSYREPKYLQSEIVYGRREW